MPTFRLKERIEAEQFVFLDGIDGPLTCARAEALGLSTNGGLSKLWEKRINGVWTLVDHGCWLVHGSYRQGTSKVQRVLSDAEFQRDYEAVTP